MGKRKKIYGPGLAVPPRLAQKTKPNQTRLTILQADVPGATLGQQLQTVRRELGLNLLQVAQAIGESLTAVYQLEQDKVDFPRAEVVKKLSELYNIRVGIFLLRIGLKVKPIITP